MSIEKRVIDGKETEVNVELVDGKEVITPVKKEVSQEAIDRIYKMYKTAEERAKALEDEFKKSEQDKVDLVERIKKLEEGERQPERQPDRQPKTYGEQQDGSWVFPETEEEWDDLIAEKPAFGIDLRNTYKENTKKKQSETQTAQLESALKVAKEILPEMYKKDEKGELLLDANGHPVPDTTSDVFKIFCKIAEDEGVDGNKKPIIMAVKNGPELIALKVKQVLGTDKEKELKKKMEEELLKKEKDRNKKIQDGQIAPPGQNPPPPPKVEVKFSSDFEKERAEQKVAQGVYKSLEEYCRIRDDKSVPYGRGNV